MKILALDTATENCSAALLCEAVIITRERRLEHGHAAHILPMVDAVLAEAGVGLGALAAIAFGRGPGAFTGVRLAASVTQGLAFGAGIPVVPVSDLQALAQRLLTSEAITDRVLACIDARMHEVYWACFERRGGFAAAVSEERLTPPEGVQMPPEWNCKAYAQGEAVAAAGSGFSAYPELLTGLGMRRAIVRADLLPSAAEVAALAVPEVTAGRVFPPEQALPVYLRNDVVQSPARSH